MHYVEIGMMYRWIQKQRLLETYIDSDISGILFALLADDLHICQVAFATRDGKGYML